MKVLNAHENILVVDACSHCFHEVNVCVLRALVVRVAPHDDSPTLCKNRQQDAIGFFKFPAFLLSANLSIDSLKTQALTEPEST